MYKINAGKHSQYLEVKTFGMFQTDVSSVHDNYNAFFRYQFVFHRIKAIKKE